MEAAAVAEGFRFLTRLRRDWASGENRFDGSAEALWGAFDGDELIGCVGLNRFRDQPQEGRLRRLYVLPQRRCEGVGGKLVLNAIDHARPWADRIVLFTDSSEAARFHERMGFVTVQGRDGVSHVCAFQ